MDNKIKNCCGIVSPMLILLATLGIGYLRPDYNHFKQAFSDLGMLGAPYFLWFNFFVFVLPGAINLCFARSLQQKFPDGKGVLTLKIAALAWILTGIFPVSYTTLWLHWVHVGFAFVAFICGGAAQVQLGVYLVQTPGYEFTGLWSILAAMGTWGAILSPFLSPAIGQLSSIVAFFLWQLLISIRIMVSDDGIF